MFSSNVFPHFFAMQSAKTVPVSNSATKNALCYNCVMHTILN